MATKSILKSVNIKGKARVSKFVNALELAEQQAEKSLPNPSPATEIHASNVRDFLTNYLR